MFDIRLRTPDLELRHLTELDLGSLAEILPEDAELDPSSTTYDGLDPTRNRGVAVHQDYWRARAGWCPECWALWSMTTARNGHGDIWTRALLTVMRSAAAGALPMLRAPTDPAVLGGQFYRPRWSFSGHPVLEIPGPWARDDVAARALWEVSAKLTHLALLPT